MRAGSALGCAAVSGGWVVGLRVVVMVACLGLRSGAELVVVCVNRVVGGYLVAPVRSPGL
jgi:hypothetical protein